MTITPKIINYIGLDELHCLQVDGPQQALFEITYPEILYSAPVTIRIIYETVCFASLTKLKAIKEGNRQLAIIAKWINDEPSMRILWWRQRPELRCYPARKANIKFGTPSTKKHYTVYWRFATSPPLPEDLRKELIFKHEGAEPVYL